MANTEKPPTLGRIIDEGATDLTGRALAGQLPHAFGRDAEVEKALAALARGRSILLLGQADVGKTAILHEVVTRLARRQCPEALAGKWVVSISTGAVLSGTHYLGEWQTRLTALLDLVKDGKSVYLYIEDIWGLRDAGRASDKADGFATLIRSYLERGDLQLLGESTPDNFSGSTYGARALGDEPSFMRHFEVIQIDEPAPEATKAILVQVAKTLRHGGTVRVETGAVERAIELTRRYQPYQAFPGKATRLLAQAAQDISGRDGAPTVGAARVVTADSVNTSFSRLTGLPEKILSDRIGLRREEIRAYFDERVVGQEEAVSAIADLVTLIKAEMHDPGRPLGVLFFVGPTGVGKTELAKALAEYLFGGKEKLIRLDMSEYKSPLSFTDLLAQLTEKQRRQSFSVILLDEIEKASPAVFDLFLQVFGDGRLTDASGRSVDLRNTIIIMTSNLGNQPSEAPAVVSAGAIGFLLPATPTPEPVDEAAERAREAERVRREVEEYFRPEFINRLDKIVIFQPLGLEHMRRIARRELGRALVREGVVRRNILIDFRDEVLDALLAAGFSPQYGARPLQRAIRTHVLQPLADMIAAQPDIGEQMLELCVRDGHIIPEAIPLTAPGEAEAEQARPGERVPVAEAVSGRVRPMDAREIEEAIEELRQRIETHIAGERYEALREASHALLEEMGRPSFWDDQERSRRVMSEIYQVDRMTSRLADLRNRVEGIAEAARMIRLHADVAGLARLVESYEQIEREVTFAEMELLASGAEAAGVESVFLCVTPQPTLKTQERTLEAVEWAEQLAEMYLAWARRRGYDAEAIHDIPGAHDGAHDSTAGVAADGGDPVLALRGPSLARMLAGERGLHKLQRDDGEPPKGRNRPTAQVTVARVDLLPAPDRAAPPDGVEVQLIGQGQEGRDSRRARAAREGRADGERARQVAEATHPATGLRVRVRAQDAERIALALLLARLDDARAASTADVVRVYHLGKTQYVHDKRTGEKDGQPRRVLSGGIDRFLLAVLLAQDAAASASAARTAASDSR